MHIEKFKKHFYYNVKFEKFYRYPIISSLNYSDDFLMKNRLNKKERLYTI